MWGRCDEEDGSEGEDVMWRVGLVHVGLVRGRHCGGTGPGSDQDPPGSEALSRSTTSFLLHEGSE